MAKNFDDIYATFAANTAEPWSGMLDHLAAELGVSAAALEAIGVGFAPAVQFKTRDGKSRMSYAWWVIPERDEHAKIVGLSLRAADGSGKVMYPGSKHGLVYAIKAGYGTTTKAYTPGRHNWVRTMDAKAECPICGKPDGCLLSRENPDDPKAVLCIRVSDGAARPGGDGAGWLHIRKPEGDVSAYSPLGASDDPVLILEGASDSAAAMTLGFEAVGRPSDMAGLSMLRTLVQGRRVLIIGENDAKDDGRHPGRTGAIRAFETLRRVCDASWMMPPDGVKDLRSWLNIHGVTKAELLAYADEHAVSRSDDQLISDDTPLALARRWLLEEHTEEDMIVLRRYAGEWYRRGEACYRRVDEDGAVRGGLYRWADGRKTVKENTKGEVDIIPFTPTRSTISDVVDALNADCPLFADPPCWLDGRDTPEPSMLLPLQNGLLDLRHDDPQLLPDTPAFFSLAALPYSYNPKADCPTWKAALAQILRGKPECILLLQEWFGYNLTPVTDMQKFMLFNGVSGSGKTTVLTALRAMLGGAENTATMSLTGLSKEFAMGAVVGKLALVIGDGGMDKGHTNTQLLLERIKEMTGSTHPVLEVRKMRQNPYSAHIYAKITMATNELQDLADSGGALPRRVVAIPFTERFEGQGKTPDRTLPDRIAAEAPGILNWAIEGLQRLRYRGEFTHTSHGDELAKVFTSAASPIAQFVDACCEVGSECMVSDDAVYAAYRVWAREQSINPGPKLRFVHNITLTVPSAKRGVVVINTAQVPGLTGVRLSQYARDRYLGG